MFSVLLNLSVPAVKAKVQLCGNPAVYASPSDSTLLGMLYADCARLSVHSVYQLNKVIRATVSPPPHLPLGHDRRVALVGSCTNYRPLQHPNIKLPCNNDKGTTGGMTNNSPFNMKLPAPGFSALYSLALSVSYSVKWPRVVVRHGIYTRACCLA